MCAMCTQQEFWLFLNDYNDFWVQYCMNLVSNIQMKLQWESVGLYIENIYCTICQIVLTVPPPPKKKKKSDKVDEAGSLFADFYVFHQHAIFKHLWCLMLEKYTCFPLSCCTSWQCLSKPDTCLPSTVSSWSCLSSHTCCGTSPPHSLCSCHWCNNRNDFQSKVWACSDWGTL